MKRYKFIIPFLLILFLITGCSTPSQEVPSSQTSLMTDRAGNPITLPDKVDSIVSLAPSITQVIEDLGMLESLSAIDTNSAFYLPDLSSLPQYDLMSPDNESLIALSPDIIFVTGMSYTGSEDPFQLIKEAGICVVTIPSSESIAEIEADTLFIAKCLNKEKEGQALVENLQKEIQEIKSIGEQIKDSKTVLFEISSLPDIYSFGKGVYLNEMIQIIGGKNIFDDQEGWFSVSEEMVVNANPDVILTNVNYVDDPVAEIKNRSGWESIAAIQGNEVYYIDNLSSSLPNHRMVTALKQMAKALYPDEYASIEAN